jgi:hypothetical protein
MAGPIGAGSWQERQIDKKKKNTEGGGGAGGAAGSLLAGALDLGGNQAAGSLSEALERQAAVQRRQATVNGGGGSLSDMFAQVPQTDPIADLVAGMMGQYNSINVAPTPLEQLQKIANQQVSAQFDPLIQALTTEMNTKKKRGAESQTEARQMYGDMSNEFLAQLPQMTQQFAAEDQATNQRYDNAQKQLQDMYGQQSKVQQQVLQNLGIQAAAPDASAQANTDQKYFQGQMESDQQASLNALNEQQMAQQNYQQNLGSTTKLAGENTAQDIGRQLEDYLTQAGAQMTGLQGQRSSTLASLLQQLQAQDAERVSSQEQQQFQNLMALSNFQLDAARAQQQGNMDQMNLMMKMNGGNDQLFKGTTSLAGAQNFLAQQYPDQPIMSSNIMQQLNDVLQNPDVVNGKFVLDPGNPATGKGPTYSDVGQEKMMELLRQEFEQENMSQPGRYSTADINNAINALAAYLGKLR